MTILSEKTWSPYVCGLCIGLLQIPLILLLNATLGTSTSFITVSKWLLSWVSSADHLHVTNVWHVGLVVGIFLGAWLSARLSGLSRPSIPTFWQTDMHVHSKRWLYTLNFVGGCLILIGARIADGCTSGNGISGASKLSIGSWLATISIFAAAIITAHVLKSEGK